PAQPLMGCAHDGVLLDRHRSSPAARRPCHHAAFHGRQSRQLAPRHLPVATSTAITQDASSRRANLDAVALAAPVLTLLLVAIIRKGAFFRPDIVVSPALTLALALSVPQVRDWARDHLAAVAAGLLATAWWIGDTELSHHSVDSWRLPAAWLCLATGYGCARSLSAAARRAALIGTAVMGDALAITGLALVGVRSTFWTLQDQ